VTCFHFDIGGRARHAGRFIGRVRAELLRALSERKAETGLSQHALARKIDGDRAQINRQFSGEADLSLRSLADLAWAMDMEISFELKKPAAKAGQNQPMTTSTLTHGQIKYINGGDRRISVLTVAANSELGQAKKSA
jgi:hypothetical protein